MSCVPTKLGGGELVLSSLGSPIHPSTHHLSVHATNPDYKAPSKALGGGGALLALTIQGEKTVNR